MNSSELDRGAGVPPPVRLATLQDRDELEAMHQAYLEVLEGFHLEFEPHALDEAWFTDQERLFPYVGTDGDGLAGYLLVLGPAHSRAMGFEVDSYVHELFVRADLRGTCLLYTSPSPRDKRQSRMPSSA